MYTYEPDRRQQLDCFVDSLKFIIEPYQLKLLLKFARHAEEWVRRRNCYVAMHSMGCYENSGDIAAQRNPLTRNDEVARSLELINLEF
jgi:hypothetical protein